MTGPGDVHDQAEDDGPPEPLDELGGPAKFASASMAQAGGLPHRQGPRSCGSCGHSLGSGVRFCVNCGAVAQFYDPELTYQVRYERPSTAVSPPQPPCAWQSSEPSPPPLPGAWPPSVPSFPLHDGRESAMRPRASLMRRLSWAVVLICAIAILALPILVWFLVH